MHASWQLLPTQRLFVSLGNLYIATDHELRAKPENTREHQSCS